MSNTNGPVVLQFRMVTTHSYAGTENRDNGWVLIWGNSLLMRNRLPQLPFFHHELGTTINFCWAVLEYGFPCSMLLHKAFNTFPIVLTTTHPCVHVHSMWKLHKGAVPWVSPCCNVESSHVWWWDHLILQARQKQNWLWNLCIKTYGQTVIATAPGEVQEEWPHNSEFQG